MHFDSSPGDQKLLRLSYDANDKVSVEIRYSLDSISLGTPTVSVVLPRRIFNDTQVLKLERFYGIYGKLHLPDYKIVDPYLISGITYNKIISSYVYNLIDRLSATRTSDSTSISNTNAAFGLGANIAIHKKLSITAEYMQYNSDFEGINLGLLYRL